MMKTQALLILWPLSLIAAIAIGWLLPGGGLGRDRSRTNGQNFATIPDRSHSSVEVTHGSDKVMAGSQEFEQTENEAFIARYIVGDVIPPEKMQEAMRAVLNENDVLRRSVLFAKLLEELTPENAKTAFETFKEERSGRRRGPMANNGNEMALLLTAWGRTDGKGVIEELTALREEREASGDLEVARRNRNDGNGPTIDGDGGMLDFFVAMSGWATTDPEAAKAYVDSLAEDDRRARMFGASIVRGMMVNGVGDAMQFIGEIPQDDPMRGRYMGMVAGEMLEQGVESARSWVEGLDDPELQAGAMSRVVGELASEDLDSALEWVSQYADNENAGRAFGRVAEEWARDDPLEALEWAADLPENAQVSAYAQIIDEWTKQDAFEASKYLAEMPASIAKDSAIAEFSRELVDDDPLAALQWAGTIGDDENRVRAVSEIAQEWYQFDQTAAGAWLETSGLDAETQQKVMEGTAVRRRGPPRR